MAMLSSYESVAIFKLPICFFFLRVIYRVEKKIYHGSLDFEFLFVSTGF